MSFAHLHVHTEYSLLDGAARIKDVVARAKELGMDSLAITDHGVMFGVIDFYREAKKQGIRPIIGCEVYTAARRMLDKEADKDKQQGHLILLAETDEGYSNLVKIVSQASVKGFYYKPRVDKELLRKYSKGIIALSACLAGDVQRCLLNDDYAGAKRHALDFLDIFGKGNFFLELQNQGLEEERKILPYMIRLREETGIPFVATNDVHYVKKEDAAPHDILLCIQMGKTVDDEDRMRFPNDEFYLKSEEEMRRVFPDLPEALEMTETIAQRCNVEFTFGQLHLPEFIPPEGSTNRDYLRQLCAKGIRERYGDPLRPELEERLEYELSVIESMGYVEYFLIVWDFINYAKSQGIVVGPGRGSAAGSIVAYSLHITDIDPVRYGLIFERFLNPERVSMPDIDVDFCCERREEVIDYVVKKYGEKRVCQICTFGTMKAKQAVRDVGRAMNIPYGQVDAIAKKIPFELKMTLDRALEINPELRKDYDEDRQVRELLDTARAVEGMPRHVSTHAAGVVISQKDIDEYVPLYLTEKGPATQFTMVTIEELGLLKMDFLGLRNLTIIRDALQMIRENHGVEVDFSKMEYNDPAAYEIISAGNTMGIFQLESGGMRQFMKNLRPDCFEDIVAGISLYRPGPMASIPVYIENKKNPRGIRYLHPSLEPILSVTYGCMVYQEQVMQIVRDLAGYTYGRSDLVRRAMSKKKRDVMEEEKQYFIYGKDDENGDPEIIGCVRNGIPVEAAEAIYSQMESFAEYAFNKSHAAAYAVVAYETAWLKVHYPLEFMAALMTNVVGDSNQVADYIRDCRELGIPVLPPDVNESGMHFSVRDGAIRFGLLGIKNVGAGVVEALIKARNGNGPFRKLNDLIRYTDVRELNKKALESMIRAGATESLEGNRAQHLAIYDSLLEGAQNDMRKNVQGQISLFEAAGEAMQSASASAELPDIADFPKEMRMAMEKEMLGVYLSEHPLKEYEDTIRREASLTVRDLIHAEESTEIQDGMTVTVAGIITAKKILVTKRNAQMAFIQLEDLTGAAELIVFPTVYEKFRQWIEEDRIVAIKGRVNFKEDEAPTLLADTVKPLQAEGSDRSAGVIKLRVPGGGTQKKVLDVLTGLLKRYSGDRPVFLYLGDSRKPLKAGTELWVDGSEKFFQEVEALLGKENVK